MFNRRLYEDSAKKSKTFSTNSEVLPFIILTADDAEIIEAIAKDIGIQKATSILAEYSLLFSIKDDARYSINSISFKNFLFHMGYQNTEKFTNNERLLEYFEDSMNEVCLNAFGNPVFERKSHSRKKK